MGKLAKTVQRLQDEIFVLEQRRAQLKAQCRLLYELAESLERAAPAGETAGKEEKP